MIINPNNEVKNKVPNELVLYFDFYLNAKKDVLNKALAGNDKFVMPIRAFLQQPDFNTQVYWAE